MVKRGSLTFFIDKHALRPPSKTKKGRGRPRLFTHPLIQLLLVLKIQYRMTYRTLEGFAKSMLPLLQQEVVLPTYSLLCKKAPELEGKLPKLSLEKTSSHPASRDHRWAYGRLQVGPKLISNCPATVEVYLADGGYDTRACRKAIKDKRVVWRDILLKKDGHSESRRSPKMPHDESNAEKNGIRKVSQ